MELKYISIDELINEVEANLYSFYNTGIDSGILYPHVVRCLGLIGAKILPIKEVVLLIENHGCDLPEDFSSLICLTSCSKKEIVLPVVHGQITYQKDYCHAESCMGENSYNHDEFGRYKNIHVFEREKYTIHEQETLILSNDIQGCVNPKRKNNYDAEIKNKHILTQRESMLLYMVYRSNLTDGDILIPDYPEIVNWLLAEMETLVLRNIYLNTTNDVAQRYQLVKSELHPLKETARAFWKRNSLQDFFSLKAYMNRNFKTLSRQPLNR